MRIGQIITPWPPKQIRSAYERIPRDGTVLDVGCFGFRQVQIAQALSLKELKHYGVDYCDLVGSPPEGFIFKKADLNKENLPFPDDTFDLVVASHIIEHVAKPLEFFGDCLRVCKPGGLVYFEAPSERSMLLPGMPFNYDLFHSLSFFDDPTHCSRPWSPQSFYRLTKYYSCDPIKTGYIFSWLHRLIFPVTLPFALITKHRLLMWCVWASVGWASFLIAKKPLGISGRPNFHYYIPGAQ
jgi:SAM-dependent methyltransferase